MTQAFYFIVKTLAQLYLLLYLLRFWLPWVRADFRNPIAQGILLIDPSQIALNTPGVSFATTSETPSEVISIPASPAIVGVTGYLQASFHPGPFSFGAVTELSNGVTLTLCP